MSRLLLFLPVAGLLACAEHAADPPATPDPPPTLAEAGGATYPGLGGVDHPVTLVDGRWEGEPFQPGAASRPTVVLADPLLAVGDVGGDGVQDAVGLLGVSGAGTGDLVHLGVVSTGDDGVLETAVLLLGDRVQVRQAVIRDGRVVADLLRAGSGDAACCPGELVRVTIAREPAGALVLESSRITGRLSLESLGSGEWVLVHWDRNAPFAGTRPPTVAHSAGALGGFGGCNRYSASVIAGEFAGSLSVGAVAGTRMACPDEEAQVETRFLTALQAANRFGWHAGLLWIGYDGSGGMGTMLFRKAVAP